MLSCWSAGILPCVDNIVSGRRTDSKLDGEGFGLSGLFAWSHHQQSQPKYAITRVTSVFARRKWCAFVGDVQKISRPESLIGILRDGETCSWRWPSSPL